MSERFAVISETGKILIKGLIIKKIVVGLTILILFNGCVSDYPNVEYPKRLSKKSVKEFKNYQLNKKTLAFVGQPLFRIKNVPMVQYDIIVVNPTEDFTVNFKGRKYFIDSNTSYRVNALLESKGITYKLINFNADRELTYSFQDDYMMIDEKNKLINKIWTDGNIYEANYSNIPLILLTPKKVFLQDKRRKINLNMELLYNGTNKDGIKLLYREYTSNDLARPAFYQNLIYDINEKEIRFKNFLIKIYNSNNQEIIFKILRDDYMGDTILIN